MYFSPILYKTYKVDCSYNEFMRTLRVKTQNQYPEEDRYIRIKKPTQGDLIYRNEYENIIFLKGEIWEKHRTGTTMMYIRKGSNHLTVNTLSYSGGFGFVYMIGTYFLLIASITMSIKEIGNVELLLVSLASYVSICWLISSDISRQRLLIEEIKRECCGEQT